MATKTKERSEFTRELRDGHYHHVKRLAFGGEIHRGKDGETFDAYDSAGTFLGWSTNQAEAEFMATKGFTATPTADPAGDLSLYVLWDDAVDSGTRVMVGDNGEQIIALSNSVLLVVTPDRQCEIITDVDLYDRYANDEFDSVVELATIPNDKAIRLM